MTDPADTDHRPERDDDEVFLSIYPTMRRFAGVIAPVEVEPEDLLQDAVVATLSKHRLVDLEGPGAYLRTAMFNLASNFRRRRISERKAFRWLTASPPDSGETYPSDLAALMWLSPRQRAVLYLSEVEGYRFAEVAEMIGCSEPAARMSATRGRRRLRAALMGEA